MKLHSALPGLRTAFSGHKGHKTAHSALSLLMRANKKTCWSFYLLCCLKNRYVKRCPNGVSLRLPLDMLRSCQK